MRNSVYLISTKTVEWSLLFLLAVIPLIINPLAYDYWYKPKIESVYVLLVIAGIAWLLKAIVKDKSLYWESSSLTIPLLFYTAAVILSTILSIDIKRSLNGDIFRWEGLYTLISYVLLVFLFINQVKTQEIAKKLFIGLILCATIVSLYGLFQYFCYDPTAHYLIKYLPARVGIASTIGNSNFLGKYLVLIIPLVFSFYLSKESILMECLLLLMLMVCSAALVLTFTRASWLSIVAGISLFLFITCTNRLLRGKKKKLAILAVILLLSIFFLNIYYTKYSHETGGKVYERIISTFEGEKSQGVATRLFVWKRALRLIKKRPWFGYGHETFEVAFKSYNIEYMETFNDFVSIDRAHNNYIDIAFSHGVIGLGTYLLVMVTFLVHLLNLLKKSGDHHNKLLYAGILSGYCGYLINDLFIFSVVSVSPAFWSLMGLTIAKGKLEHSERTIR